MAKVRIQNFVVHGISGFVRKAQIEKALKALPGISKVQIHNIKNIVTITFDEELCSADDLMKAVRKSCGAEVIPVADSWQLDVNELKPVDTRIKRRLIGSFLLTILICLLSYGPIWGFDLIPLATANLQIQLGLCIFVMALHYHCYVSGFKSFIHFIPEVNTLLSLGTLAAFCYSCLNLIYVPEGFATIDLVGNFTIYFDLVAGVLTLYSLGSYLENKARNKIVYSLAHLHELTPTKVTRRTLTGQDKYGQNTYQLDEIDLKEVKVGDTLVAKAGDRVGADGYVVEGNAYLDEHELAGHSLLQRKLNGSFIHCGSSVRYGYIAYKVTKTGADTTLAQIISQPDESNSNHLAISNLADRLAMFLVPMAISVAVVTFYIWSELGAPLPHAISYAVAVLLVSCPGAISLAAPFAVSLVVARALSFGVMIRNYEALENTSQLDIMVFDKTGIITKGNYKVVRFDMQESNPLSIMESLWIVRLLEGPSDHVLACSIVSYVDEIRKHLLHSVPKDAHDKILAMTEHQEMTDWHYEDGLGVSAKINGQKYFVGSSNYVSQVLKTLRVKRDSLNRYEEQGLTTLYLFTDSQILMSFALTDEINPEASYVVKTLDKMHVRSIIVSGDSHAVVERVAREVNIDTYRAWYLPQDKLTFIKGLENKDHYVGIVDSGEGRDETLEQSDVCITLARNLEFKHSTADIVLLHSNLKDLIPAILLSKLTIKNIRQNLILAIAYHVICLPLAAGCLAGIGLTFNPLMAVVLNMLSVMCVILNALRLKHVDLSYRTDDGLIKISEKKAPNLDTFNEEARRFDAETEQVAESSQESKSIPLEDILTDILHDIDTREVREAALHDESMPSHILVEVEKKPVDIAPSFNEQQMAQIQKNLGGNKSIEVSAGNVLTGAHKRYLREPSMSTEELDEWYAKNIQPQDQGAGELGEQDEQDILAQDQYTSEFLEEEATQDRADSEIKVQVIKSNPDEPETAEIHILADGSFASVEDEQEQGK